MAKNKRRFHAARKVGGIKQFVGMVVAACICILLGRVSSEMGIGALSVVLAVISLILILNVMFIFIIGLHDDQNNPMKPVVQHIPTIIILMLLLTPSILGYATKTTFLIQQNGCRIGGVLLGHPAFMRILVGGVVLCIAHIALEKRPLQRRWLCAVLKACALGGSICAAAMLTYMCLITQGWLLFPEAVVLLVMAVSLLLVWKRARSVSEND